MGYVVLSLIASYAVYRAYIHHRPKCPWCGDKSSVSKPFGVAWYCSVCKGSFDA